MQVLVIGYVWPEPDSSAAGRYMLSLLETFVAQGWRVTFASAAQSGEHRTDLTQLGIIEQPVKLNCDSFDHFVNRLQPDIVLFDRFMLEEQFAWRVARVCPNALRILDSEDLHSLRDARHQAFKAGQAFTPSTMRSPLAMREVAAIFRSDLTLLLSDVEQQLLQAHFSVPPALLHHCPFMLDPPNQQTNALPDFTNRQHFICIGNFRHAPNWDSVLWLHQQIWPLIRQQLPTAELHVCGAYPPKKATQLHNPKQGFLVKGWVADAAAHMQQARVCLAPLRFGAGIKGKLVEAMQNGTPSVTTAIGSEGMGDQQNWPGAVAESAPEIAQQAIDLYQNQNRWQQARQQGWQRLRDHFDKTRHQQALISKILETKQTLTQHRSANFIGAMLQHHSLQASKYMSQWIAAKNQPDKTKQ